MAAQQAGNLYLFRKGLAVLGPGLCASMAWASLRDRLPELGAVDGEVRRPDALAALNLDRDWAYSDAGLRAALRAGGKRPDRLRRGFAAIFLIVAHYAPDWTE